MSTARRTLQDQRGEGPEACVPEWATEQAEAKICVTTWSVSLNWSRPQFWEDLASAEADAQESRPRRGPLHLTATFSVGAPRGVVGHRVAAPDIEAAVERP